MRRKPDEIMRSFWNAKARENAMYYVSSYRPYDAQDPEDFWRWGRLLAERFLSESGIRFTGDESMLEIGCGIGRMTGYFAERFGHVTGIDISDEMIALARSNLQRYDNVDLVRGNGCDLAVFSDASFDFVFSYIVLQHIPKPELTFSYIREMGRVLRPGGHGYFQVNNCPVTLRDRLRIRSRVRGWISRKASDSVDASSSTASRRRGPSDLDSPAWQGSRVSTQQVERACEEGGMEVLALSGKGTQYLWVKTERPINS